MLFFSVTRVDTRFLTMIGSKAYTRAEIPPNTHLGVAANGEEGKLSEGGFRGCTARRRDPVGSRAGAASDRIPPRAEREERGGGYAFVPPGGGFEGLLRHERLRHPRRQRHQ